MDEKHNETEETYQEKRLTRDASVRPPMKRKSESFFEYQSKRSTDNATKESNESLTDYRNIEDTKNLEKRLSADIKAVVAQNNENITVNLKSKFTASYADFLKERENRLVNAVVSHDKTTEENIKEQGIDKTDKSPIKYKLTETTNETDFATHEIQPSNKISKSDKTQNSDKVLHLKDADVSSAVNHSVSQIELNFLSSLDVVKADEIINPSNTIRNETSAEENLPDSKNEDIATENLRKIQKFPKTVVTCLPKQTGDKLVKCPSKMTNKNFACGIPLQMSQNSYNTTESDVSNISESSEHTSKETLPPQKDAMRGNENRSIARASPEKLFSDSERNLIQIYQEVESNIINLEYMENDPHFIESQRLILESVSHEQQEFFNKKPESDEKEKFHKPFENKCPEERDTEISLEAVLKVCGLAEILSDSLNSEGRNLDDQVDLELICMLTGLAQTYDPDSILNIPYVVMNYRECLRQSPAEIKIVYERLIEERLKNNEKAVSPSILFERILENLPLFLKQNSPDSSSSENEPDNNSGTNSPEFRENPGLSKDGTRVKKDSRYQKKFYKRNNPVSLPLNRNGDAASISDIETNRNSEENRMQVIDGDSRIACGTREDIIHEESGEDPEILLKNKDMLKVNEKSLEDKLSGTSASASEDKINSFMKESLAIPHSLSPKRNSENKTQSLIEGTSKLEGLDARLISTAIQVSSTQAVASCSRSTQHMASQTKIVD